MESEGKILLLTDCHTHTKISPDSSAALSDMCRKAQELHLQAYAVTDHIELCRYYPQGYYQTQPRNEEDFFDYAARWEQSMNQNLLARDLLSDQLNFISGIELGEPNSDFDLAKSLYQDQRLDFVIASLHELPDKLDFYFLDYQQEDINALLENYFTILLEISRQDCFDVLGHVTYPLRYIAGDAGIAVDFSCYRDMLAECFKAVIQNHKGIELNTSGYRQPYGKPFPDADLLKLYYDLGGRILTLGSDAHKPEDLGGGIETGTELAKACGFEKICYFLRHEPHFINL
ncbi:MAG: histidinol-phosphatase HisJ family protein [Oscillospiraceae bacterium]|nr:histidinol-phosphatase HisJ family protein [Oscillospiraceae bacterium]